MVMSNETDILIVGHSQERFTTEIRQAFRHWQVYSADAPFALHGRKFRNAYYTEGLLAHPRGQATFLTAQLAAGTCGGQVLPFSQYEEPTVDTEAFEDAVLVSQLRRSRYAQDWV
jgi:hypothetical protein